MNIKKPCTRLNEYLDNEVKKGHSFDYECPRAPTLERS
jgi:hypothetical protein